MQTYPLTVPITVHRRLAAGEDDYGNPVVGRWEPQEYHVFAVETGGEADATGSQPDRQHYDLTVYAPVDMHIDVGDRLEFGYRIYEVIEPPGNWEANPWWKPGLIRIRANRIEGGNVADQI